MKYYEVNSYGKTYKVRIEYGLYEYGNTMALSLIAESGEPFCNLTVNLADSVAWADDRTAFVDTNNCPWAEEFIRENDLGYPVGYTAQSGFCEYPLYRFDLKKICEKD